MESTFCFGAQTSRARPAFVPFCRGCWERRRKERTPPWSSGLKNVLHGMAGVEQLSFGGCFFFYEKGAVTFRHKRKQKIFFNRRAGGSSAATFICVEIKVENLRFSPSKPIFVCFFRSFRSTYVSTPHAQERKILL